MLDKKIKKFLQDIGRKGGKKTAQMYDMRVRGRRGAQVRQENQEKLNRKSS